MAQWTISHSIPDYEHDGDYEREARYIGNALAKAGINLSTLRFKLREEEADRDWDDDDDDERDPYGYVEITGDEATVSRNAVRKAIDEMEYD